MCQWEWRSVLVLYLCSLFISQTLRKVKRSLVSTCLTKQQSFYTNKLSQKTILLRLSFKWSCGHQAEDAAIIDFWTKVNRRNEWKGPRDNSPYSVNVRLGLPRERLWLISNWSRLLLTHAAPPNLVRSTLCTH